ncbi:MAG: CDP-glucose 4,6-dehydratase [Alphaproteobacteria bacterium]|nr:CDP-glucose 4,6-dehydratase [Alphaproteobacteria bacterium]
MQFWRGKRVLITGDTGFKGSWLTLWLHDLGAQTFGCALPPDTTPALFNQLELHTLTHGYICDIRDEVALRARVLDVQPDVIFHLAAQPLVRLSYDDPLTTWGSNVMGTANLLNAVRALTSKVAVVAITTDKVYQNLETTTPYTEADRLGGHDPYSASKAATELVVASYRSAFFQQNSQIRVATARAGNVIGGGDWAQDRLVPDIVRALAQSQPVSVRNPNSVRPWQHVLDPLSGYLRLAERLYTDPDPAFQSAFNFGPNTDDSHSVKELVEASFRVWPGQWSEDIDPNAPHEANLLNLTIEKSRDLLGWSPRWDFAAAVEHTLRWYQQQNAQAAPLALARAEIVRFMNT